MSEHQSVPQTQDGSTEQSFVDSDYSFNVPGADFGGFYLPLVTFHQNVDQWLHVSSWSQNAASLGSMSQEGVFGATAGSAPLSCDGFSEVGLPPSMIGTDSHLNDIDSARFTFSSPLVPCLDLPTVSEDISKMASPTACDQTNDTILDSSSAALGNDRLPAYSFDVVASDSSSSPADNSADNNSDIASNQTFKEDPAIRLKNNEFVEHGKWLCIWPECDKFFKENRMRNNHLRTHLKPVHCSWYGCNFRDSCQKDMRRHFRTHRSLKTVQCRFCGKWFTRKYNLSRHEREMHGGNKRVRK
ncbi:hypothetical protein FPOA_08263 [Fusarium poae]|uniref:C2H2-type domain-containing protein n=1 Tax=Fusarium poae TaxID=36050 RepID=A0A1B8ANL4_FUSPO|nr:hypothetical protein FPOA_08263 [Fusarium poae]